MPHHFTNHHLHSANNDFCKYILSVLGYPTVANARLILPEFQADLILIHPSRQLDEKSGRGPWSVPMFSTDYLARRLQIKS